MEVWIAVLMSDTCVPYTCVCACMCAECAHCVVVNIPFSGQLVTCREKWVLDLHGNNRKLSFEEVLL